MITRSPDGRAVSVHRLVQAVTLADLPDTERDDVRRTRSRPAAGRPADHPEPPQTAWPAYARLLPHARTTLPPDSPGMGAVIVYLSASGDYRTAKTLQHHRVTALHDTLGFEHSATLAARANLASWTGQAGGCGWPPETCSRNWCRYGSGCQDPSTPPR